ncbi:MAG: metal-dependent transcriptional regulator [Thermoplasmatales archaeon]|nr:metal-dependent transcriptional regulator [Thermoplasmatales archaeon]
MNKKTVTQSVEDYLEIIYNLEKKKGFARTSDISSFFGHKASSVTGMIQKLDEQSLVNYEKYGGVTLTGKGKKIAKKVSERHETLSSFLKILGVNKEIAEEDACMIEHSVHKETMERLRKFVSFVQNAPRDPKWLHHFEYFIKTGKHPKMNEK